MHSPWDGGSSAEGQLHHLSPDGVLQHISIAARYSPEDHVLLLAHLSLAVNQDEPVVLGARGDIDLPADLGPSVREPREGTATKSIL